MRVTLTLDDHVLSLARAAEGASVGAVVSRLARQGIASAAHDLPTFSVPADAPALTPEMVRQTLEET